ncbi:MAG: hypothetical protein ABI855_09055 [Bacteroidota bacterium]
MKLEISKTAFWDTDMNKMDETAHADFIIARVFQYGLFTDLKCVLKNFSDLQINHALKSYRGLDQKTIDLAKTLGYLTE